MMTDQNTSPIRRLESASHCDLDNASHDAQRARRLTLDMERIMSEDNHGALLRRPASSESVRTMLSVSSILVGTAGKLGMLHNAVKSSVKDVVAKTRAPQRQGNNKLLQPSHGSGTMRKRSTSVLGLAHILSRGRTSSDRSATNTLADATKTSSPPCSLLDNDKGLANKMGSDHLNSLSSVRITVEDDDVADDHASRAPLRSKKSSDSCFRGVGSLLFGKEIEMFFAAEMNSKSREQLSSQESTAREVSIDGNVQDNESKESLNDDLTEEEFQHLLVIPQPRYRVEGSNVCQKPSEEQDATGSARPDYSQSSVQHLDEESWWFRTYYLNNKHVTFCGMAIDGQPTIISAVYFNGEYRLIMRQKEARDIRKIIPDSFLLNAPSSSAIPSDSPSDDDYNVPSSTWKNVLETSLEVRYGDLVRVNGQSENGKQLASDLLKLDEIGVHSRYKFGVLCIKEGQKKEEEWFSNSHDSAKFERFLDIIGERVELLGYQGWVAGLDRKGGGSGTYTYTSQWKEYSLAYHVSSLMPFKPGDPQQIHRKRHIGNDIVCIVFVDGNQPFDPTAIKSQFLHVFIVVREGEWHGRTGWQVEVASVQDVPEFGPALPENAIFFEEAELRAFMLAKLINAEYAALKSSKFEQPMARARDGMFASILERGFKLGEVVDCSVGSRHSKSPSTSSDRSVRSQDGVSVASKSSMMKDLSDAVGIGRRRGNTQSRLHADGTEARQRSKQKSLLNKGADHDDRSRSDIDLSKRPPPPVTQLSASRSSGSVLQGTLSRKHDKGPRHRSQTILGLLNFGHRRAGRQAEARPLTPITGSPPF